jgi:hypothetical protein
MFKNNLFTLIESDKKGRCVCATGYIEANSIILQESPLILELYETARKEFCAYCTDKLLMTCLFYLYLNKFK